jgi:hypothetical protein
MTREELECAIRKPAEKVQLEFKSGLIRRILNDVGDEPGNLPLLEFVLKELWDERRGGVLLNETYDAIGGLQGAVATKADQFFKDLSSATHRWHGKKNWLNAQMTFRSSRRFSRIQQLREYLHRGTNMKQNDCLQKGTSCCRLLSSLR